MAGLVLTLFVYQCLEIVRAPNLCVFFKQIASYYLFCSCIQIDYNAVLRLPYLTVRRGRTALFTVRLV